MSTLDPRIRLRLPHQREENRQDSEAVITRRAFFAFLVTFIVLLLPAILHAQIPVDGLVNMDNVSPQPPGTAMTQAIANNGSIGGLGGWGTYNSLGALSVGAHQPSCSLGTAVTVGGKTYTPQSPSQSIAYNNSNNFSSMVASFPSGITQLSVGICIVMNAIPPSNLIDFLPIFGTTGGYVAFQLRNSTCLNLETDGSGTLHSGCITPTAGATYWCTFLVDSIGGVAKLACYLPVAPFTQVGSTVTVTQKSGSNFGNINVGRLGNNEVGTANATTYFENLMFDWTNHVFPLGVGTSGPPPPPPPAPVITSALSASGNVGSAFSYQVAASSSPTSFNATGLPAGLSVNTSNGLISGVPTTAGSSNVSISATNAGGTGTATLALTINSAVPPPAPVITSPGTATGIVGTAFSYQITASNSPTSFSATGLPAGLSVNTSNGVISGTPTAAGSSNVSISASNTSGTGTATVISTINSGTTPGQTPWSGIIGPSRAVDWSQAGVVGGIPGRMQICQTLNPGATVAQINSAMASCPPGQTVFLNAGTYNLNGTFNMPSNVTLRGAGADQTLLVFSGAGSCTGAAALVCMSSSDGNWKGGPSNLVNWTAGYPPGTTNVTLASVPNLKVGNPIILDQLDDDVNGCDAGGIIVAMNTTTCTPTSTGVGGPFSLEGNFGGSQRTNGGNREQEQIVTVVGCNGSTTPGFACSGTNVVVTISPGLYMPNWRASQSPQAWWATNPKTGMGLENLSIDATNAGTNMPVQIFNSTNSWVKGIRSIAAYRSHVQLQYAAHITVRDSYFYLSQTAVPKNYGFDCYGGYDSLVENNIYHAVTGPIVFNSGCGGNVVAYNFTINQYYTASAGWNTAASSEHTAGVDNDLYEGNVFNLIDGDVFHGTHNFVTVFRNRLVGNQPACYSSGSSYATSTYAPCNNNRIAAQLRSFTRFHNYIGNVMGTLGINTTYSGSGDRSVFVIGNGNSNGTVTVPGDPNVATTLMRWGNYDVVSGAVRWCGDSSSPGWTTICGSTSEVPSGLSSYANQVPATTTLPPSFYLPAKPSWWTAGKPWPAIGPDVMGGNASGVGGFAYTIPAQDCYFNMMGGPAIGDGLVLTFNANTCYPSSSATLPAPPTGLNAIVH